MNFGSSSSQSNPPISFQFRSTLARVLSKYVPGEKKVLDHHVTPAASSAPGCPKSSSFYTGVNLVPVNMAGMATVGNNRHAAAASTAAANRCKTMGPNMGAEDPTRVRTKEGLGSWRNQFRVPALPKSSVPIPTASNASEVASDVIHVPTSNTSTPKHCVCSSLVSMRMLSHLFKDIRVGWRAQSLLARFIACLA